jgi:hypothetical protein
MSGGKNGNKYNDFGRNNSGIRQRLANRQTIQRQITIALALPQLPSSHRAARPWLAPLLPRRAQCSTQSSLSLWLWLQDIFSPQAKGN